MDQSERSSALDCFRVSRSKTILVADDNESVRAVMRSILVSETAFEVCGEAIDGVDAIDKAGKLRPDLIILDVAMPRMNGLQAASILRGMMPHARIVLFTMYGDVFGPSPNSTFGVDAVISKLEGMDKLVPCVQNLLQTMETDELGPSAEPRFEPGIAGICRVQGCPNNAKYCAEWSNVTKLVCDHHKKLVERKHWSEVAHLFGRTPFTN
jgi:CheY-like chemotaxis protein